MIFGYRLSRFRRSTENNFGILISVFRIFCTKINPNPEKATEIVATALALHNFL